MAGTSAGLLYTAFRSVSPKQRFKGQSRNVFRTLQKCLFSPAVLDRQLPRANLLTVLTSSSAQPGASVYGDNNCRLAAGDSVKDAPEVCSEARISLVQPNY